MEKLINNIEGALIILHQYQLKSRLIDESWTINSINKVLVALKEDIDAKQKIRLRILRAMKDIYVVVFRNFEGTDLYQKINIIDDQLSGLYNNYGRLEPLGMDFGKGNPI